MRKLPISEFELSILKSEYAKCKSELDVRYKKFSEIMSDSKSFPSKTPGYSDNEAAISGLKSKIAELRTIFDETTLVSKIEELPKDRICVYSRVVVEDRNGMIKKFYICHFSGTCQDPGFELMTPGSPLGKAMIGKREGDIIEYEVIREKRKLTILKFDNMI